MCGGGALLLELLYNMARGRWWWWRTESRNDIDTASSGTCTGGMGCNVIGEGEG